MSRIDFYSKLHWKKNTTTVLIFNFHKKLLKIIEFTISNFNNILHLYFLIFSNFSFCNNCNIISFTCCQKKIIKILNLRKNSPSCFALVSHSAPVSPIDTDVRHTNLSFSLVQGSFVASDIVTFIFHFYSF